MQSIVLRRRQVCQVLGIKFALLDKIRAQDPSFPKAFKLAPDGKAIGWLAADIEAWAQAKKNSSVGNETWNTDFHNIDSN